VAFQLAGWTTAQFPDETAAAKHRTTIERLGCEVQAGAAATEFSYRCLEWNTLNVDSHQAAEQWIGWLASSGFDVSHAHADPTFSQGAEVVAFRLIPWTDFEGTDAPEDQQLVESLQKIGCEVRTAVLDGRLEVRYRAPTWRDIHFPNHASAQRWTEWLARHGFETRHDH